MSKRLALIIASYEYEDPSLRKLIAPSQDAETLSSVLSDPEIGNFEVQTLLSNPSYKVNQEIDAFFIDRKSDDLLLLYFSGHGIKDEDGMLYFATADTNRKMLRSTAIQATFVNDVMRNSRSRRQILLLDCCYSGAFARGMVAKAGNGIDTKERLAGRGRVVLTASDSMQYAFEGDEIVGEDANSIFTRALVEGLKTGEADLNQDGNISFDELYEYVYDRVTEETPKQKPEKWDLGVQGEMVIARNPNPVVKAAELPSALQESFVDLRPFVREGAVRELNRLLQSKQPGLVKAAQEALENFVDDDSTLVKEAAKKNLARFAEEEEKRLEKERAEAERIAVEKAEAERIAAEKAEAKRLAAEKAEAERKAAEKAEAERIAVKKAEAKRLAAEKAEAERLAAEKAEAKRLAAEKAEAERLAAEKAEAKRIAAEKAEVKRLAVDKTGTSVQSAPALAIPKINLLERLRSMPVWGKFVVGLAAVGLLVGSFVCIGVISQLSGEPYSYSPSNAADKGPSGAAYEFITDLGGREVTIMVENEYPPFNMRDPDSGEGIGWDYDTWREICDRLNCVPVFTEAAWPPFEMVAAGEVDVAADAITIDAERSKIIDFSDPYLEYGMVMMMRTDNVYETAEDFENSDARVASQAGTTNETAALALVGEGRVDNYDEWPLVVEALLAGDADGVATDEIAAVLYINEHPDELMAGFSLTSGDFLAFVFPPGSPLIGPVNTAIQAMLSDGTLDTICQKWLLRNCLSRE